MKIRKIAVLVLFIFISSLAQSSDKNFAKAAVDLISINNNETKISPNSDGHYDTIDFNVDLHNKKAKIKKWEFVVIKKKTTGVAYSIFGKKKLPDVITWNGKDDSGNVVEGLYGYVFKVNINDKDIKLTQDGIIVDITPPKLSVYLEQDLFLIGDDNKPEKEFVFYLNVNDDNKIDISRTDLKILNSKNEVIKEWKLSGFTNIPSTVSWDGYDELSGDFISEGEYKVIFSAYDILGNGSKTSTVFKVQKSADVQKNSSNNKK